MIQSKRFGAHRIPGDIWGHDHYDWPAPFRTLAIPVITLQKIHDTQKLRDLIARCLEGIQSDEVLFNYVDTARLQLNQKIQSSLRAGWNANADQKFNRDAMPQFKRHLRGVRRLAVRSKKSRK